MNGVLGHRLGRGPRVDQETNRSYLDTWRDLWEQLDQARGVIIQLGRDSALFDAARVRAGDPLLVAGGVVPLSEPMREAARDAITALRAAVPEIVIPEPPPPPKFRDAWVAGYAQSRARRPRLLVRLLIAAILVAVIAFATSR
ncbi:MAG TPA: hypothetical protein VGM90_16375 [Kofleriaceae bacterium]